jgi:CHAD domain-containing protein
MTPEKSRTESLFRKLQRLPKKISAKPDADNVHELRTTIRRLETLLDVTSNGSGRKERKLKKQMDRVRRRAGRVRDLDVQIIALEDLRVESVHDEKQLVLQFLRRARAKREAKLLKALDDEIASGLMKHLGRTAERVSVTGNGAGPEISAVKPDPAAVVARALDSFRDAVERYGALTEQNLHPFRLACKRVRYVAEMAGDDPEAESIINQLKRVQDAIGEWHDWVALGITALKILPTESSPLISAIRANTRSKFLNALRIADEAKRNLLTAGGAGPARTASRSKRPAANEREAASAAATA